MNNDTIISIFTHIVIRTYSDLIYSACLIDLIHIPKLSSEARV